MILYIPPHFYQTINSLFQKKITVNIAVFLGGISPERNVSLASGRSVANALREAGHTVVSIDPALGKFQQINFIENLPHNIAEFSASPEELVQYSLRNYFECVNSSLLDGIDVLFLTTHGKWGEDGVLQSLLELRGIQYTGSRVLASALAMDKAMAKVFFEREKIATPRWKILSSQNLQLQHSALWQGKFPCVVKPNEGGSTIGMSMVQSQEELLPAIASAKKYSSKVLLEEYIEGKELTVPVLGETALPVIEIKPKGGFYDYQRKYTKGETDYICPAELPLALEEEIREAGLRAYAALGCEGYARTDFRLQPDGKFYCLEVNTLPGMTATSLVPKAAKAVGIEFPELCERIVKLALRK